MKDKVDPIHSNTNLGFDLLELNEHLKIVIEAQLVQMLYISGLTRKVS